MPAAQTGDDGYTKVDHRNELAPKIVHVETFREGDLVFFNLFFVDPNKDAEGFGFRGANGTGWDEETHPFSDSSYGRVSLMGQRGESRTL